MIIYPQVEKFVLDSITQEGRTQGIPHFKRTVYWLKEIKPDADEAMLCAAIGHDIERASRDLKKYDLINKSKEGFTNEEHLKYHQEKGADMITDFLKTIGVDQPFIDRVWMLIAKHEVGGNDDQNFLKDADSISFFENQVSHFITEKVKESGIDKVKKKFDWMFNRITNDKAKEIAKPMYEKAIELLIAKTE
jgi:hypothetical protein